MKKKEKKPFLNSNSDKIKGFLFWLAFLILFGGLFLVKEYVVYQRQVESLNRPIKQITGVVDAMDTVDEHQGRYITSSNVLVVNHKLFKNIDKDMWSRLHIGDKITMLYREKTQDFNEEVVAIRPILSSSK